MFIIQVFINNKINWSNNSFILIFRTDYEMILLFDLNVHPELSILRKKKFLPLLKTAM